GAVAAIGAGDRLDGAVVLAVIAGGAVRRAAAGAVLAAIVALLRAGEHLVVAADVEAAGRQAAGVRRVRRSVIALLVAFDLPVAAGAGDGAGGPRAERAFAGGSRGAAASRAVLRQPGRGVGLADGAGEVRPAVRVARAGGAVRAAPRRVPEVGIR